MTKYISAGRGSKMLHADYTCFHCLKSSNWNPFIPRPPHGHCPLSVVWPLSEVWPLPRLWDGILHINVENMWKSFETEGRRSISCFSSISNLTQCIVTWCKIKAASALILCKTMKIKKILLNRNICVDHWLVKQSRSAVMVLHLLQTWSFKNCKQ